MDGEGLRYRHARRSGWPELRALLGTAVWWALYFHAGSRVATVFYGGVFVGCTARLALALGRGEGRRVAARIARGFAFATALSSAMLLAYWLLSGNSRRFSEGRMDLGVVHLALVGPLFLLAAFLAWIGRQHEPPARLYYMLYPGSWVVLVLFERMA
jgi:hypothetical protein